MTAQVRIWKALHNFPNGPLNPNSPNRIDGNALDLPFVSTNLNLITECRVDTDTHGSDHFLTFTTLDTFLDIHHS